MKDRTVNVHYGLRLTNGNYGSEEVSMGTSAELEEGEEVGRVVRELHGRLVAQVVALMRQSRFPAVREQLRDVKPLPDDDTPF